MSTQSAFWPETRRALAQWAGIALASIISGLLLGVLLRQGMNEKLALEIALPVGFLVALLCWISVSYWFATRSVRIPLQVSPTVPNFEGQLTAAYSFQMANMPTIACQ